MFSNEEEKLMKYNQNLEQLALNEDKLNEAIEAGFRKAQFDKKKRKKWWLNAAVVAALFFIFSHPFVCHLHLRTILLRFLEWRKSSS